MPVERRDLHLLIAQPAERPDVEYKGAMKFGLKDPDPQVKDFSHKLIKHILGHANAGGGHMVIGMKEDHSGALVVDDQMTAEVATTYESTRLSEGVNKKVKGSNPVELTVHTLEHSGRFVVVIEVQGFSVLPFFTDSEHRDAEKNVVLRNHTLYVRSANTKTVDVCSPEDFEIVLRRALTLRNEDFLTRFRELTLMMGITGTVRSPDPTSRLKERQTDLENFVKWGLEHTLANTLTSLAVTLSPQEAWKKGYFYLAHVLVDPQQTWDLKDLRDAMRQAELHRSGWPMGMLHHPTGLKTALETELGNARGIQEFITFEDQMDFWVLREDGSFYLQRVLSEDDSRKASQRRHLSLSIRVFRFAEALEHTHKLYTELGVPGNTRVLLEVGLHGLKGRELLHSEGHAWHQSQDGQKNRMKKTLEVTVDQLQVSLQSLVLELSKTLLEDFGVWDVPVKEIEHHLEQYLQSDV